MSGGLPSGNWQEAAKRLVEDPAFREQVARELAAQGISPKRLMDPGLMMGAVGAALPPEQQAPVMPPMAPPRMQIGDSGLLQLALATMMRGR